MQNRLYIIHGYGATTKSHWFPWLESDMKKLGFEIKTIFLPNSENPKIEPWLESLKRSILEVDENSFFVAHSLGCVSVLRFLQEILHPKRVGGYILVSGFYGVIPEIKTIPSFVHISTEVEKALVEFSNFDLDHNYLTSVTDNRAVIASTNDYILPFRFNMSRSLAKNLRAKFYTVENGGHFLTNDGYKSFPLVKELLIKMSENI